MSERGIGPADDDQSLTQSRLARVVATCDDFEVAWRDGLKPRIEDYLTCPDDPLFRSSLLSALLAVELELRSRSGEFLVLRDYLARFPDDAVLVRGVFESTRLSGSSSEVDPDTTADEPKDSTLTVLSGGREGGRGGPGPPRGAAGESEAEQETLPRALDRFKLLRLLGVGMFGKVYLAWDPKLEREVAIKIPRRDAIESSSTAEAFLAEAKHAAKLRHWAIVTIYDVGTLEDGTVFVVMDYIEGSTLRQMLKNGPLAAGWAAGLIVQVADALHYAHTKKLVHRDIKPANILIDRLGQPYVADFGLAVHQTTEPGRNGELAGTIPYMAPEQVRAETHRLDRRTDVWALGVILYELLTRRRPFIGNNRQQVFEEIVYREAKPPRQLNGSVPVELERICLKCLSKRMNERYQTAAELADDLRDWLATRTPPDESSVRPTRPPWLTKVVPKGLRSFSPADESFFLELMPGPRDRDGLPEIVRYWKTRIEATDRESAFAVGLIFGPSGCGKSSLVHAGILPKLEDSVLTVSVAAGACARGTEAELLRRLRHRCPDLAGNEEFDLPEALRRLRQGKGLPPGKKLLIVLDQFEQYLQSCPALEQAPLVEALRQCDGEHVQCLVLVRDDFWIALTRFLRLLEIDLSSDRNMTPVDLFDRRHARAVLAAFGRGHGALPEDPEALTNEQKKFLDQAINGLADGDRVICVRLALFAEMFKDRPWTPSSLREQGGIKGVGVAFLKATIGPEARHPALSLHADAARAVLESLLPPAGSPLKGRMRSHAELLTAAGYHQREGEFRELLRVLDSELRLITPAEEPDAAPVASVTADAETRDTPPSRDASRTFYQLTHDYLVHSIRDWVEGMRQERDKTKRGRALVRLHELTTLWSSRREPRHLPSLFEWSMIRRYTRRREWPPASGTMMDAAARRLGLRLLAAVGAIALLVPGGWHFVDLQHREALVQRLDTVGAERISYLLPELRPYRSVLRDQLLKKRDLPETSSEARLTISLLYLPEDPGEVDFLVDRLQEADADELKVIRDVLERSGPVVTSLATRQCWLLMRDPAVKHNQRVRAAAALAALDSRNAAWEGQARDVAAAMIQETPANHWIDLFRPVRSWLTDSLLTIYQDEKAHLDKRVHAGNALAAFFSTKDDVHANKLVELILDANPQQFPFVLEKLRDLTDPHRAAARKRLSGMPKSEPDDHAWAKYQEAAVRRLFEELDKTAEPQWNDVPLKNNSRPELSIVEQLENARGLCKERFAFCQTLPLESFQRLASDLKVLGYRPSCVRPYTADGKVLVAATWVRDGLDWKFAADLTARQVDEKNKSFRAEWEKYQRGFLPVDVACYLPPPRPEAHARNAAGLVTSEQPRYAALWVAAQLEPDGRLTSLEFVDAKMYVGVEGENEHSLAYKDLINAKFVPRTNLKWVDRDGTFYSSVRWKLPDPPRDRDTWNEETWKQVEDVVKCPSDLALTPIDVRFSRRDTGGAAYATTWWSGVSFESVILKELSPEEHVRQGAELERNGYRPMGISARAGDSAQSRIVTASVWRRPLVKEDDKDRLAARKATAAIALYLLDEPDPLKRHLTQTDDLRLRSELIERLATFEVDIQALVPYLDSSPGSQVSLRRSLLLVLASIPNEQVPPELRKNLEKRLGDLYRDDPDRGIHSAAELVLRNWKLDDVLQHEYDELQSKARPIRRLDREGLAALGGKEWFITPGGQTMVVLHGPRTFLMGSPGGEPLRDHWQEPRRSRTFDRTIAVDTKEVTLAQFLPFFPHHANHFDRGRECPVNNVTWYEAVEYCNKRSEDEGLEKCYPDQIGPNMELDPDSLNRNGYRLPTEVEAEFFGRAGTNTTWFFGHSQSLVSRYAWTLANSATDSHPVVHPVGQLLPNDFGLFDTAGNVFEWCQDRYYADRPGLCDERRVSLSRSPRHLRVGLTEFFGPGLQTLINPMSQVVEPEIVENEKERVMRGGSFLYIPLHARSAYRDKNRPIRSQVYLGFRVVRTLPVPPSPK